MKKPPDVAEEKFLQRVRRDYGRLAAWVMRSNRLAEPARPAELTRAPEYSRTLEPSRILEPSRAE